jgi:hypothetical protein
MAEAEGQNLAEKETLAGEITAIAGDLHGRITDLLVVFEKDPAAVMRLLTQDPGSQQALQELDGFLKEVQRIAFRFQTDLLDSIVIPYLPPMNRTDFITWVENHGSLLAGKRDAQRVAKALATASNKDGTALLASELLPYVDGQNEDALLEAIRDIRVICSGYDISVKQYKVNVVNSRKQIEETVAYRMEFREKEGDKKTAPTKKKPARLRGDPGLPPIEKPIEALGNGATEILNFHDKGFLFHLNDVNETLKKLVELETFIDEAGTNMEEEDLDALKSFRAKVKKATSLKEEDKAIVLKTLDRLIEKVDKYIP